MSTSNATPERIDAKVKDYVVHIDLKNHTILHDCEDWRKNMDTKNLCKHLGKLLLSLDQNTALDLLRSMLKDREQWKFAAP